MKQTSIWVLVILFSLVLHVTNSAVEEDVKSSLINFLAKLNGSTTGLPDPSFGWNLSTDPCLNNWRGIVCDSQRKTEVRRIYLNQSSLSGVVDAAALCNASLAKSLRFLKLDQNSITGNLPAEISNCKNLVRLLIPFNQFEGSLPESLLKLNSLQRIDISFNDFSGSLPDLARISGLNIFLAENNRLSGELPNFELSRFQLFNVSSNNFSGPIPAVTGRFTESSFLNNPGLCGPLLKKNCSLSSGNSNNPDGNNSKNRDQILMYSGYGAVGFAFMGLIIYKLIQKNKRREEKTDSVSRNASTDNATFSGDHRTESGSKSEFSANSSASAILSTSLVVLTSPVVNGLRFEDVLKAPAELLARGKHSSLYRVICENGLVLAVKRIKDWAIPSDEFKQRMERIYQAQHPNVLAPLAFYSSTQDKLLVYQYQNNGSLCTFLQGTQMSQALDWMSRLNVASTIAEALAFMHRELGPSGIAHGNLKSSNILFNSNMEACISEYGLMVAEAEAEADAFKADVCCLGVIVLELLTGKPVLNNGMDLRTWVHSVVREEWTVEVFDKILIAEGASEDRMLNLLHIAIRCVNVDAEARPTINEVAITINAIKEEEDRSLSTCEP